MVNKLFAIGICCLTPLLSYSYTRDFNEWIKQCENSVKIDSNSPSNLNLRFTQKELDTLKILYKSQTVVFPREAKDYSKSFVDKLQSYASGFEKQKDILKEDIRFIDSLIQGGKKVKDEKEKTRIIKLLGKRADSAQKIMKAFSEDYQSPNQELKSGKIGKATKQALAETQKDKEERVYKYDRIIKIITDEKIDSDFNGNLQDVVNKINRQIRQYEFENEDNVDLAKYEFSLEDMDLQPEITIYQDTVTNPFYIETLYKNYPDVLKEILIDNTYRDINWLIKKEGSPWAFGHWYLTSGINHSEMYPYEIKYVEYNDYPQYRIVGNNTEILSIWDASGNFIAAFPRPAYLFSSKRMDLDMVYAHNGEDYFLAKDAYQKNYYDIQLADPKTSRYVRIILGLEDLTDAERANIKALQKKLDSSFAGGISSSGNKQDSYVWQYLSAQEELKNQPWKSEAGKRWLEQIAQDYSKIYPYEIVNENNNTYTVYFKNKNGELVCLKRLKYIPDGPFKVKEVIEYLPINK